MIDNNLTALIEIIEDKLQRYILNVISNISIKRGKIKKLALTPVDKTYPPGVTTEQILNDPDNTIVDVVPQYRESLPGEVCLLPKEAKDKVIISMVEAHKIIQQIKNGIISINYTDERQCQKIITERLTGKIPVLIDLKNTISQSIVFNQDIKDGADELLSMAEKLITEINNNSVPQPKVSHAKSGKMDESRQDNDKAPSKGRSPISKKPIISEYLLSDIHRVCNNNQFDSISLDDFKVAINSPGNQLMAIKKGENLRVYYLISRLKGSISNNKDAGVWLNSILNTLGIKESTYKSKYSDVGKDDLNSKNEEFKSALDEIFDRHDT